jgi:hypothetical protein
VQPAIGVVSYGAQTLSNMMALALMLGGFIAFLGRRGRGAKDRSLAITAAHPFSSERAVAAVDACQLRHRRLDGRDSYPSHMPSIEGQARSFDAR